LIQLAPVICISGELDPAADAGKGRRVSVYLDANSLWPARLEWFPENASQPSLRIEFLDPELNRELGVEECTRLFSYTN
jgi:hypothetical protein